MSTEGLQKLNFNHAVPSNSWQESASIIVTKPIDTVENIISNTVDTFTPATLDEEQKKSHKTAIRVGSTILVVGALAALLNPKFSSKFIEKMRTKSAELNIKYQNDKTIKGNIYKKIEEILRKSAKILNFSNNFNSVKDSFFKKFCTQETKSNNKLWVKIDKIIVTLLKKPHEVITKTYDKISRHTVYKEYEKASSNRKRLHQIIKSYKRKLAPEKQKTINQLLELVKEQEEYFSETNIKKRLNNQEKIMSNLTEDIIEKTQSYVMGFLDNPNKREHISKNMKFWAEDILEPQKHVIISENKNALKTLLGDGKTQKGTYDKILDTLMPNLSTVERSLLKKSFGKYTNRLKTASKTECVEYFDKKRDLTLGSAPTDILSAIVLLALSGIAIGTADNRDERISRTITVAFPALAGLGVSTTLAALLFSGLKGALCGSIAGSALSLAGSTIDKHLVHHSNKK